jgi:cytochrome P450
MASTFSAEAGASILEAFSTHEGRLDPHPTWHRLRAVAPVYRQANGELLVTGYAETRDILCDDRWLSVGDVAVAEAKARDLPRQPMDEQAELAAPVDLVVIRPVVNRLFSTAAIGSHRTRIANVVATLLDDIADRGEVEILGDFSRRLPLAVLAELLGMPTSDRSVLVDLAKRSAPAEPPGPDEIAGATALQSVAEFMQRIDPLVAQRREKAGDDLLSALVQAFGSAGLAEVELRKFMLTLVIAAFDTTSNLVANAIYVLLKHPDQLTRLRADQALLPTAVEEVLRWAGSVKAIIRIAAEDVPLRGETVAAGTRAGLSLSAANRDPSVFSDPDRFDIARRPNPHLALAKGSHHCLGAALARQVTQESIRQFFERFPGATVLDDGVRFHDDFVAALTTALPVRLKPSR